MSDETQKAPKPQQAAPAQEHTPSPAPQETQAQEPKIQPSYESFAVQEDKIGNAYYKNIGAAFAHKDGKGHTLNLAATPVNGKIVLREPRERLEAKRNQEGQDRDTQTARGEDQGRTQ